LNAVMQVAAFLGLCRDTNMPIITPTQTTCWCFLHRRNLKLSGLSLGVWSFHNWESH